MQNNFRDTDLVIVQKIIDYCDQIEELISRFGGTFDAFQTDSAFQLSCGMCIIQIGELTARLSNEFKARCPEIPWKEIKGMRNVQVHDYEHVKFGITWETLTVEIPALKESLSQIEF